MKTWKIAVAVLAPIVFAGALTGVALAAAGSKRNWKATIRKVGATEEFHVFPPGMRILAEDWAKDRIRLSPGATYSIELTAEPVTVSQQPA